MARYEIGSISPEARDALEGAALLWLAHDVYDAEHLELLKHHPGLAESVRRLREDLEYAYDWPMAILDAARADPEAAPYPVRALAEEWGLSPAVAAALAIAPDSILEHLHHEASRVTVVTTATAYVVRIPRPVTPTRRQAVREWLKSKWPPGPVEHARGIADRSRQDRHVALLEALPWFDRWNAGEEPAVIWRSIKKPEAEFPFDNFVKQLERVWARMREISPQGVRSDRPSKKPA